MTQELTSSNKHNINPPLCAQSIIAFGAMVLGMFMAILDIQIVASSLSVIAAGLCASPDELSWIQTAYLIAEVIVIPITGFLAKTLSTRLSYFFAAAGFTVMSFCCALASNIEMMICFRFFQGLFGGAMIPTVFGTVYTVFPPEKRSLVSICIGLVVTIAPTLGPTIGGYVTDVFSWHFMFLLNIAPGILVCVVVFLYANFDSPNFALLKNFDYFGMFCMTCALATLQYLLEEGNKLQWFDSGLIIALAIISFVFFTLWIAWEAVLCPHPIVDLSAFKNKDFSFACIYSFTIGIGLYGAVYILPLFLFSVARLNTIQIGTTMMVTGCAQFLSAPLAGRLLATDIDLRKMLAFGLVLFSIGCYYNSFLTPESRFHELLLPQFLRGFAMMFCFLPTNIIALGNLPREVVQNASGLYNLTRNLGGAVGLAIISTIITSKTAIAQQYLNENITQTDSLRLPIINSFGSLFQQAQDDASLKLFSAVVARDAFVIAMNDTFCIIALLFIACLLFLPFTSVTKNVKGVDSH
ncbi:MFS transporter [Rickettsiales endosymbiont of Paramecium tredecaurelia]|uniref:DHA2 family efflux MFS transporter permease subunit n=1 Tax=Candidatus Sarmatiella mevalonica TaxID=2770581 RepID=UPI001920562E|nr:DHA2 family efflux MFS transporter permease subunit [Candidatus Sarmatiella mevalonica]MBL3284510.1 MFS transporter [Candidatus Sarmatiella mevalonica]